MMDKNEQIALRNYLTCFESRKKGHKPKSLILLDLIEKYAEDEKVAQLLKKKVPSEDAQRMVISRLRDKMFTSLTLDVNLVRDELYDEQGQALAKVALGKIQARILISRGQRKMGFYVFDRCIKLAKQYEIYDELVDMLGSERQGVITLKGTEQAYYKIDNQIQTYEKCRDAVRLAKKYYEEILLKYGLKGLSRNKPDLSQLKFLKERIDELNQLFEDTSSSTVGYYYYYLRTEYSQIQNKLKDASEHLKSLAVMVENNPAIRKKVRLMNVYGNIGANELWMHEFKSAESYFIKALEFSRSGFANHALMKEYLFYSQFYQGSLEDATESLEHVVHHHKDQSAVRKAIRNYLLACVKFANGEFKQVSRYLLDSHEIDKHKEGWNIWSRILSIMVAIEQEKLDLSDSLIVNLRQFIRTSVNKDDLRKRDVLVEEILLELRKKSYNFEEVSESRQDTLLNLAADDVELGWRLQTPEMICFHTWFNDKLNGMAYQANYNKEHIFSPAISQS